MSLQLKYFPPASLPSVVFDTSGKFMLHGIDGFASLPSEPTTTRGPFQPGVTLLDSRIGGKVLSVEVLVWGDNREDYWVHRNTLAQSLSLIPQFDQSVAELGLLRFRREGQADVEIPVLPMGAPSFQQGGPLFNLADIDFFAPSPWWRAISDSQFLLEIEGGIEIPETTGIEIPETTGIEITLNTGSQNVNNNGHTTTPVLITINGEIDTPRLTLEETGESLEITGVIASGDAIRINTEFGKKEVTLISGGIESNAFDMLNTSRSDFFQLRPGNNTINLTFAGNVSGDSRVRWRPRFAGV